MKTYEDIEGYFNFSDLYDKMFEKYKNSENVVFIELGVWLGRSIIYLAEKLKRDDSKIKLFAIDNFTGTENLNPLGKIQLTKKLSNELYEGNFYKKYNQNVIDCEVRDFIIDIQKPSIEAVKEFEDNSIDFMFIDGDHHYNAVIKDLNLWYPKIKRGGIFSGHDIGHPGVIKALNEFTKKYDLKYLPISKSSWKIQK